MRKSLLQRIGVDVEDLTFNEAIEKADLRWNVVEEPVFLQDGRKLEKYKALLREDTREIFTVINSTYEVLQPGRFLDMLYEVADVMEGKVTRLGLEGTERIEGGSLVGVIWIDSFALDRESGPDPIDLYYVFISPVGRGGLHIIPWIERVLSRSGYSASPLVERLKVRFHTLYSFRSDQKWEKILERIVSVKSVVEDTILWLAKQPLGVEEFRYILETKIFPSKGKTTLSKIDKLVDLFVHGEGNTGSTRWDALCAFIEYYNYHLSWNSFGTFYYFACFPKAEYVKLAKILQKY